MIIGISGFAGSGKDTVADLLSKGGLFVKVAFADPLKRIARDVYDFSDPQLWGPSEMRNQPDERYPRPAHAWRGNGTQGYECVCCRNGDAKTCFLTPRYALQLLGSEWGRQCYPDTWVEYVIRVEQRLQRGGCYYDQKAGIRTLSETMHMHAKKDVVTLTVPDVRFKNEISGLRDAGGKLVRVIRTGFEKPQWAHQSEREQASIPDDAFDYILRNDEGLDELALRVDRMLQEL